ncbi:MAG: MBL fold metallo-hydrolase [Alphaproteobacteria bacterium]
MRVRFWGTRGSLAAPLDAGAVRAKVRAALERAAGADLSSPAKIDAFIEGKLDFAIAGTYGGNTACVEIDAGSGEYVLCDLGTGVRVFAHSLSGRPDRGRPRVFNVFLSHVHWDHIMGFPFFPPAYAPGNLIRIHGCHASLETALRTQHSAPWFPVDFSALGARIEFVTLEPGRRHEVAGLEVSAMKQRHSGDSYGYRFERDGKAVVYSTDSEHRLDRPEESAAFVAFFKDADLVIFDAMYSLADAVSVKADWGHSSNIVGVELCHRAGVKHYCMFHHEPIHGDAKLQELLAETVRYEEINQERARPGRMRVSSAYDGMEIEL